MKPIDQQVHDEASLQLEQLKSAYEAMVPGQHDFDALIKAAIEQYGIANLTGVPLERVSVHTKLVAMQRLMASAQP